MGARSKHIGAVSRVGIRRKAVSDAAADHCKLLILKRNQWQRSATSILGARVPPRRDSYLRDAHVSWPWLLQSICYKQTP
jgi:hypothetical protein